MTKRILALVLAAGCCALRAEDVDNPFKSAKVGDWVQYRSDTDAAGTKMQSTMKQTVTEKTDTSVTIAVEMEANGQKLPSPPMKIDLTQKFDPATAGMQAGVKPPKVEKLGEGDETLNVGGKEYKAHWNDFKMTLQMGPMSLDTQSKVWVSKDVPLSGMVRTESKMSNGFKTTIELVGSSAK